MNLLFAMFLSLTASTWQGAVDEMRLPVATEESVFEVRVWLTGYARPWELYRLRSVDGAVTGEHIVWSDVSDDARNDRRIRKAVRKQCQGSLRETPNIRWCVAATPEGHDWAQTLADLSPRGAMEAPRGR